MLTFGILQASSFMHVFETESPRYDSVFRMAAEPNSAVLLTPKNQEYYCIVIIEERWHAISIQKNYNNIPCQSQPSNYPGRLPLLCYLQGGVGRPPVILAYRRWGPTYTATHMKHSGLLGRLLQEVLHLFMWWRPLELAKEASCSALSSSSTFTLGLMHQLHPTAMDTIVAPGGVYGYIAASP